MTGLGNCSHVIGDHLLGDWPWQMWKCLSASSFTVTGLGNCGNVIGDHLALANVEMLSARTKTVTGLGKCGNVIGENLHGDWPWQL